jgi:hypothetical protein
MKETYLVFCIQGYDYFKKEEDTYYHVIDLEIIATSYKEALKKAKTLSEKKNFRLKMIIEKYRNDNT